MKTQFFRGLVASITLGAIAGASPFFTEAPGRVVAADRTGLVYGILGVAVLAAGTAATRWRPWLEWVIEHGVTLTLGLLGTVVGFMIATHGATTGEEAAKLAGVGTALSTTVVGIVAHLYLLLMERVTR